MNRGITANSWFATMLQGGHVGGQYNRTFSRQILPEIGVKFPEERNAFVLGHQHGRRDITCNPAIPTGHPDSYLVNM